MMSSDKSQVVVANFPRIFAPLDDRYRHKVMYGGRGSAKSWSVSRKLLIRGLQSKLLILCTRELQKSIKQSVHRLLSNQIVKLGLTDFYKITDTSIKGINGTEFFFLGVRFNTEEIRSTEGIDICWIEEGQNLTGSGWNTIDPTIRKDGSEIWITFNTRFKSDFLYRYFIVDEPPPSSWVQLVNYTDNPYFPEALKIQAAHMKIADYEKYLNIWLGKIRKLAEGAIFGPQVLRAEQENRILEFAVQPGAQVHTFWDLGKNDHTAIWFMQDIGGQYRFIDYYENRQKEIEHYCRVVMGQCRDGEVTTAENTRRQHYLYGTHYMPHDVEHNILGMTKNRKQQFIEAGIYPVKVVPRIDHKMHAIELGRQQFSLCYFHSKFCERGIEALSHYRFEYNDQRDSFHQNPFHDWASNGADAFMQFPQGYTSLIQKSRPTQYRQHAIRDPGMGY